MKKIVARICAIAIAATTLLSFNSIAVSRVYAAPTCTSTGVLNAVVVSKILNVREGPGTNYKIVCKLKAGDNLKVIGKMGEWYAVYHTPSGCVGAAYSKYIRIAGNKVPPTTKLPIKAPTKAPAKVPPKAPTKVPPKVTTPPDNTGKAPTGVPSATNNVGATAEDQQLLDLVNKARADAGASPLKFDAELMKSARLKAQDMVNKNYFDHQSPTYGSPFDMMRQFGISFKTAGENIAGNPSVADAFDKWMKSEGHRKNILNPSFNYVGFGIVPSPTYGKILVQQFIGR